MLPPVAIASGLAFAGLSGVTRRRGEPAHHPDGADGEQGNSDHRQARDSPPRVTAVLGEDLTEPAPHVCRAITSPAWPRAA
jgi:hypothetical protein